MSVILICVRAGNGTKFCVGVYLKRSSKDQAKEFEKRCEKKCCGLPLRLWRAQQVVPPIYDTPLRNHAVVLRILIVNPKEI